MSQKTINKDMKSVMNNNNKKKFPCWGKLHRKHEYQKEKKNDPVFSTDLNSLLTAVTTTGAKADQSSLKH